MKQTIYLDYAAATPVDESVQAAMRPFYAEQFYNPSATYLAARGVKDALQADRERCARVLGARPSEITFTAGGTEANNLAINGVMQQYPGSEMLTSAIEHESVLEPVKRYKFQLVPVDHNGVIDITELKNKLTDSTVLISVHYANNEVGTVQPLKQITEIADTVRRERRKQGNKMPLYVHTDACQAGNYLDISVARLGVDMMTLNGGKIYGPKQSGILYAGAHVRLRPQILGGGQEFGRRSGTENIAQSAGLAAALELTQKNRQERTRQMQQLQTYFLQQLQQKIPGIIINGSQKLRLPNNVHVTIPSQDNERLIFALDDRGIMVAAGSACSASSDEPSHVLRAMGVSDADARASLRMTMGKSTTKEAIDIVVQTLADVLE
jgi:cysteine desulfurase